MKAIAAFTLGFTILTLPGIVTGADDKKEDKKDEKKDSPKADSPYEGKYTLVSGKKNGMPIDETAKKIEYSIDADKITIKAKEYSFVISYKINPKATPAEIDMVILDGPEGSKGSMAAGIIELKGDTLKLAYGMDKDKDEKIKRPKNFEGKEGMSFEFKKAK